MQCKVRKRLGKRADRGVHSPAFLRGAFERGSVQLHKLAVNGDFLHGVGLGADGKGGFDRLILVVGVGDRQRRASNGVDRNADHRRPLAACEPLNAHRFCVPKRLWLNLTELPKQHLYNAAIHPLRLIRIERDDINDKEQ